MSSLRRVPFLGRLAKRYALRHRSQTIRAILGLLVATSVLATGLGMGESMAVSLERAALARFGPVDLVLQGGEPFDPAVANRVAGARGARSEGVEGAATFRVTGSVVNPAKGLAEAFATIRGVGPDEPRALGPLHAADGSILREPKRGEIYLTEDLARRVGAAVGDAIVLHAPIPGAFPRPDVASLNFTGATGAPPPAGGPHVIEVGEDALGLFAFATRAAGAGGLAIEARSPSGQSFTNATDEPPVTLFVPPPIEAGPWSVSVTAPLPTAYLGTVGVAYAPPSLASGSGKLEGRVAAILADEGRAAVTFRPSAIVPLADLQEATGMGGLATHAYYRVTGDPRAAVAAMTDALPEPQRDTLVIRAVKADAIDEAREAGSAISGFLLVMGGFTLIAAALLAYALFSALVEERRPELGIGRALGLTRGEVALSMTLEGGLYAGLAALAGLVLGLGILWALLTGIASVSAREGGPPFGLHVSTPTLVTSFLVGALIPLATIGVASLRFARLDPARAIRGIPEDPKGRRRAGLLVGGLLVAMGLLLSFGPISRLLGVPVAIGGVAVALASLDRKGLALLVAFGAVAQVAWTLYTFDDWPAEAGELDPIVTMARGALLALGLAALAVASPAPYAALARLLHKRAATQRASFVALKYLLSRRRAAGLTMAMIALVVVVVTVMGTLFLLFGATIPADEAGYAVVGETPRRIDALPSPLPPDLAASVTRVDFLARHFEFRDVNLTHEGRLVNETWYADLLIGVPPGFAESNGYEVVRRAARYATDRDAWLAVSRGEAVIFPAGALPDAPFSPGDVVTLKTALGRPVDYVVAGGVRSNQVFGSFLAADHVRGMGFPQSTFIVVRTAPDADAPTIAHRLTAEYAPEGVTFVSVAEEAERIAATVSAAILVFEAFLALGLFVGLAATGFLASRAVHERGRDIGTLRALGYEEADVKSAFVLESTATSAIGLLIGLGVGLLVAGAVWWREIREEGVPFRPPWLIIGLFFAAVLGLSAIASWGPARRAARLPPALAVRYVE